MWTFNGQIMNIGGNWLHKYVDPYNPLGLPPQTLRVKFMQGYTPNVPASGTRTLVDEEQNIWDLTWPFWDWSSDYNFWGYIDNHNGNYFLEEVIGFNTEGIRKMPEFFSGSYNLKKTCLFDLSNIEAVSLVGGGGMFENCISLEEIPPFDLSKFGYIFTFIGVWPGHPYPPSGGDGKEIVNRPYVPNFDLSNAYSIAMFSNCNTSLKEIPDLTVDPAKISAAGLYQTFANCPNVETGMLRFYNKFKDGPNDYIHINPEVYGNECFKNCGTNTESGRAERAQIPTTWGGDMQV